MFVKEGSLCHDDFVIKLLFDNGFNLDLCNFNPFKEGGEHNKKFLAFVE